MSWAGAERRRISPHARKVRRTDESLRFLIVGHAECDTRSDACLEYQVAMAHSKAPGTPFLPFDRGWQRAAPTVRLVEWPADTPESLPLMDRVAVNDTHRKG